MTTNQRDRILACACDLYLADGLDGFSMRKLAQRVGVTAPALYRHYDGKEMVLRDVMGEAFTLFGQYLYRSLEGRDPADRLRRAGEEYLSFALEHSRLYKVIHVSPELMGMDWSDSEVASVACGTGQFLIDRVRECMDAGLLRKGDPTAAATTIWAHSHGLTSLYLRGLLPMDQEQFRAFFRESGRHLMLGLATEAFSDRLQEVETST